jgi:tRNA threonylcarbamoyladenosine biosynthesis protein TsaB
MLLAIDTSTQYLGVALYDGICVLSESIWLSPNHHTVDLAPTIEAIFNRTEQSITGLNAVAVALGPGSFTGLRIGLAFCKGLALSCNVPIIGIPSLDVLAYGQPVTDVNLATLLKAGRGRLAVAWYFAEAGKWMSKGELENLTYEDFVNQIESPSTICGEVSRDLVEMVLENHDDVFIASPAVSLRRPSFLAELAWNRWKDGDVDDPRTLKPVYLHHGKPIPEG